MPHATRTRPARVLLVDDNPADVFMMQEGLAHTGAEVDCHVANDGQHALEVLEAMQHNGGLPDLVVLDLNMPRLTGLQVLERVRAHAEWGHLPVVIMTSSTAPNDVMAAYRGHANAYIAKPMTAEALMETMARLERFWLDLAQLPPL